MTVRHVSIGGTEPRRLNGTPSWDGIGEVATEAGLEGLFQLVEEFQPHAFLFGIHFGFDAGHLARLRESSPGMRVFMHYTDQRDGVPQDVSKYGDLVDVLLLNNRDGQDHAKYGVPTETFYDGIDPAEYYPKPAEPTCDVFFGGNDHYGLCEQIRSRGQEPPAVLDFPRGKFRHDLVERLHLEFDLVIRGRLGWGDHLNVKPMRFHPRYLDAMLEGRIVLATAVNPRRGLIMRRIFRSLATGRLLLSERVPGIEGVFKNHEHFVLFDTIDEAVDLARYYLDRPEERARISEAAWQELLKHHTFGHRLEEFVAIVRRYM